MEGTIHLTETAVAKRPKLRIDATQRLDNNDFHTDVINLLFTQFNAHRKRFPDSRATFGEYIAIRRSPCVAEALQ